MAVFAVLMAILALAIIWWGTGSLLWLHRKRTLSDVPGTVVWRDRRLTGRGLHRMYPVVDFTTPDGAQIRRTASLRLRAARCRPTRVRHRVAGIALCPVRPCHTPALRSAGNRRLLNGVLGAVPSHLRLSGLRAARTKPRLYAL